MKEVRRSNAQKIGGSGEGILEYTLKFHGAVNRFVNDFGIDFICSLFSEKGFYTGHTFFAQCKGTENYDPLKNEFSLSVQTSTVRFWMKQRHLTFLFCVDIKTKKVYWVDPIEQLKDKMKKIADNQQTITIKVPQKNIFPDNSDNLFPDEMINCMRRFDEKLFSGYFVQVNKDIDIFSNSDYFSNDLVISDGVDCINIKYRNVNLIGFYWSYKKLHSDGSCLIQIIRHIKKAENDLTFNHQQILDLFYQGLNTKIEYGNRKYIKDFMDSYGQFIVDLGNSRIYLYPDEVKDLCKVIDIFMERYLKRIYKYQKLIGSLGFEPFNKDLKLFKLMTVDLSLWKLILLQTRNYASNDNFYEIGYKFSETTNENIIELLNKDGNTLFIIEGYKKLKHSNSEAIDVDVIWKYPEDYYNDNSTQIFFSVSETYEFIVKKILQSFKTNNKRIFRNKVETKGMNFSKEAIRQLVFKSNYKLDLNNISDIKDLIQIILKLRDFLLSKNYLELDYIPYKDLCIYIEKRIFLNLTNYNEYSVNFFEIRKKKNNIIFENIEALSIKRANIKSNYYASILDYIASILAEFSDIFTTEDPVLQNLYKDLQKIINWYNEEKLINMLI